MNPKRILGAITLAVLVGLPAAAAQPAPTAAPEKKASPILDFGRWLEGRMQRLARPFTPGGDPGKTPAGPRYDTVTTCDPSRIRCPIG